MSTEEDALYARAYRECGPCQCGKPPGNTCARLLCMLCAALPQDWACPATPASPYKMILSEADLSSFRQEGNADANLGPRIGDLFNMALLADMITNGYVRTQDHPVLPLMILNYTEKATYERVWNPVTTACRGLIVNTITNRIVARPFPKFFNHNEPSATFNPDARCVVTDKMDGSLGIAYPTPDGPAIATRGSFTSEQAVHATEVLRTRYPDWQPPAGWTALFEIVYPANRIVVDYGGLDDLVLLSFVHTDSGHDGGGPPVNREMWGPSENPTIWPGPVAEMFPYRTLAEALAAPPRPGKEGLVVHFADDRRVKIKQDDYVRLHRILTGLTARYLWRHCAVQACLTADPAVTAKRMGEVFHLDVKDIQDAVDAGRYWLDKVSEVAPEECLNWISDIVTRLADEAEAIETIAVRKAAELRHLPRKNAAALIADHPSKALVFSALDGRSVTIQAWAAIYPKHERPFLVANEDTA